MLQTGLSTPELNSLLEDLDGYNGNEGVDYNLSNGGNYDDYMGSDYAVEPMEDEAAAVKRSAQPEQGGKSAAAAAMLPAYCDPPNPCPPGKVIHIVHKKGRVYFTSKASVL